MYALERGLRYMMTQDEKLASSAARAKRMLKVGRLLFLAPFALGCGLFILYLAGLLLWSLFSSSSSIDRLG